MTEIIIRLYDYDKSQIKVQLNFDDDNLIKTYFIVINQHKEQKQVIQLRNVFSIMMLMPQFIGGRRGRYNMVVGFTITCAISAYHH